MQNSLITANYYYSLGDLYTIEAQRTADAAAREHCFVRALENYQRCKDIAVFNKQDPHLPGQLGAALIGIGSVNLALKHYDRTEEIFKDMLEHSKDKSFRIVALRNLSAVCYYEHRQAERNNYEAQLARLDKK
jgi:hypothetical protein